MRKGGSKGGKALDTALTVVEPEVILGSGGPTEAGWHGVEAGLRCLQAYQFGSVRGIRKPLAHTPDHFAVGTLFHAMRARWFALRFQRTDAAWRKVLDAVREAKEEQTLPISTDAERRALDLMQHYMNYWATQPKPNPVAAEYKIGPAPLAPGDPFFWYRTARLDDVSRYPEAGDQLCIGESKTTSTSVADTVKQYELHGQPLLQLALWRMCPNGERKHGPVAGVMLDVSVKGYEGKDPKFGRVFVPVKQYVTDWFIESMRHHLSIMAGITWDTRVPRNTSGCTYMAGRMRVDCEFKSLCMYGREATGEYVLRDGSSLRSHEPAPGRMKMPWE